MDELLELLRVYSQDERMLSHRDFHRLAALAREVVPEQQAEIERLREELADWREAAETAAGETCGDEKHCTCVPLLRMEIERLRAVIAGGEDGQEAPQTAAVEPGA
jgi:hypothetical protein